jgi:hypothetical protein
MKKDIEFPSVSDVAVAIVTEKNELNQDEWNVYLLNLKDKAIEGVLVSSRGYGELNQEKRKTSELRHFLNVVDRKSFAKIEPILEDVFGLNNEYWVSFYLEKKIYDKKFIFLPESISKENLISVPLLNKKGVLIK